MNSGPNGSDFFAPVAESGLLVSYVDLAQHLLALVSDHAGGDEHLAVVHLKTF